MGVCGQLRSSIGIRLRRLSDPTTLPRVIPPLHEDLDFNGPLSIERADRLLDRLGPLDGAHVVDLGCGWAELLLRAAARGAIAHGIDQDAAAIAHGQALAAARNLTVTLEAGDASTWQGTADVLIVTGSTHLWGGDHHTETTLRTAHAALPVGGRLLLGEGFWEHPPSEAQLAAMPITLDEYGTLPDLVDLALSHGYRLHYLTQATLDDWDDFQSRHALGWERWLAANPDHPEAASVRSKADTHRDYWLRGWRGVLGLAYLVLVKT